jgi:ATP-dependent DNA helicase DinG
MPRCRCCTQPVAAHFCCSRVIARCATLRRFCCGDWARRCRFPVLVQGDAPREALLSKFREYGNAGAAGNQQLLGRRRRQGAALSVVVIDKLPFAAPDDPVLKARLDAIERAAAARSSKSRFRRR